VYPLNGTRRRVERRLAVVGVDNGGHFIRTTQIKIGLDAKLTADNFGIYAVGQIVRSVLVVFIAAIDETLLHALGTIGRIDAPHIAEVWQEVGTVSRNRCLAATAAQSVGKIDGI